jgi:hypothetical protein
MGRLRGWIALALLAALQPACKTWAKIPEHTVNIVAVERVAKGEDFTFTVHLKDDSGQALKKVEYEYRVDWVGVEGSTHKAKSGILQSIRAKGGTGPALLHILGYDAKDQFGEIARFPFEVQ